MTFRMKTPQERSDAVPSEVLYGRIHASVRTTPASTVRTRTKVALALAATVFIVAIVLLTASELVYDRQAVGLDVDLRSTSHLWSVLFLIVGLTLVSTLIAVSQGRSGLGPGVLSLGLVAGLVAPVYALLVLESPVHAHDAGELAVEISPWGLRCLLIATIVGMFVLVSFAAALRRAVPTASRIRGAALGAAAGAWAGLTVFMFCPSSEYQHLLVGHVLPIVAFTILGSAVLPRALRP
mgnify:FL=1